MSDKYPLMPSLKASLSSSDKVIVAHTRPAKNTVSKKTAITAHNIRLFFIMYLLCHMPPYFIIDETD